jgi:prepilin-type N-terminal cleavage/methylation domain-containing protein
MDRIYKMMKRNNKGFTLVELMVVLLIIGILVAIAIPIYNSTQKNAKVKADQANVRTLNGATAQWAAESTPIKDLTDPATKPSIANDLVPTYLKEEPDHPFGGTYTWQAGTKDSVTGEWESSSKVEW